MTAGSSFCRCGVVPAREVRVREPVLRKLRCLPKGPFSSCLREELAMES